MEITRRHISMKGGYNFRDLGGYRTFDGKTVKWNTVLRSDDLATLTDDDLELLGNIPLISIVDFRGKGEIEKAPDRIPGSVREVYFHSINPGNMDPSEIKKLAESIPMDQLMQQIYVLLVTDPEIIEQYKNFFALLQNPNNTPLLFHCSAGKDRTGMAAALFLLALGVEEETVIEDYLLSNQYIFQKYASIIADHPEYEAAFGVKKEFIEASLDLIKKEYGGVENYLRSVLDVDIEKLREIFCETVEKIQD